MHKWKAKRICSEGKWGDTYRQFCEGRVANMSPKNLLLKLEQLDHQAGQRFIGGGLSLYILKK